MTKLYQYCKLIQVHIKHPQNHFHRTWISVGTMMSKQTKVLLTICFFTIFSSFRHSIVVSITDYLFVHFSLLSGILLLLVLLTICFFTILSSFRHSIVVSITNYLFLQFSLLSGILLWLVLLDICFYSSLFFPAFYCY